VPAYDLRVRKPTRFGWLIDAFCGLVAYVVARWTWSRSGLFENLPYEALTFLGVYLLLQAIVRGRRLAKRGREA
jgi:hypothetical protein